MKRLTRASLKTSLCVPVVCMCIVCMCIVWCVCVESAEMNKVKKVFLLLLLVWLAVSLDVQASSRFKWGEGL